MLDVPEQSMDTICVQCGGGIAPGLLTCPSCRRLVHAEELKKLASDAQTAEAAGDARSALAAWNEALHLLPHDTRQHELISARVDELGRNIDAGMPEPFLEAAPTPSASASASAPAPRDDDPVNPNWTTGARAGAAGLGTVALLLLKFKWLAFFLLTKAKFLLLGLTKASTFLSMFASLGLYWAAFGWELAAGLIVSLYIHEMGHVAALMHYGIPTNGPVFIPGFGAYVRGKVSYASPYLDARVALAGPLWGLGVVAFSMMIYALTGSRFWGVIGQLSAVLNVFAMVPLPVTDGGHAFRALSRRERWLAVIALAIIWFGTSGQPAAREWQIFPLLAMIAAACQAQFGTPAKEPDRGVLVFYVLTMAALASMLLIPVKV
jgi:Zn-dependent protease